jgi:hypothetical protein
MKTIKLAGPFSDADIVEFVALLRRIDDANPAGVYAITVTDPDKGSMDGAERFVSSLLPALPDRATKFARASYRDDSCSPRACDNCNRTYRGPAVYCSFECAIADA